MSDKKFENNGVKIPKGDDAYDATVNILNMIFGATEDFIGLDLFTCGEVYPILNLDASQFDERGNFIAPQGQLEKAGITNIPSEFKRFFPEAKESVESAESAESGPRLTGKGQNGMHYCLEVSRQAADPLMRKIRQDFLVQQLFNNTINPKEISLLEQMLRTRNFVTTDASSNKFTACIQYKQKFRNVNDAKFWEFKPIAMNTVKYWQKYIHSFPPMYPIEIQRNAIQDAINGKPFELSGLLYTIDPEILVDVGFTSKPMEPEPEPEPKKTTSRRRRRI